MNFGEWRSVFAIPTSVVDKHMKHASCEELKVLLWILKNTGNNFSVKDIANELDVDEAVAKNALSFWNKSNLLSLDRNLIESAENSETFQSHKRFKFEALDNEYVNNRIKTSSELNFLMQEAKLILGRTISAKDKSLFVNLHDNGGLPIDVIVMLLQYAVNIDKKNMRFIEKLGISWIEEDIDNLQKAEEKIEKLNKNNKLWLKFEKLVGLEHHNPSNRELEIINKWYNDWNIEEILLKNAFAKCINLKGKFVLAFMDSILNGFKNKNNISDYKKITKKTVENKKYSYDIDEYESYDMLNSFM